ncbi:MAG TPA: hypothetical protein ENK65_03385 [Helicobacteraceae bacterium]|nr:hypothetical protein [Helicobacteraceae bacterium]
MKTHRFLDKKIRIKRALYFLIALSLFITVLYDSYHYDIPFYYILFFFAGTALGRLERFTSHVDWDHEQQKMVETQDYVQVIIFIILLLFRIFVLPQLLDEGSHPIHLFDATALITFGVFYYKIRLYQKMFYKLVVEYTFNSESPHK